MHQPYSKAGVTLVETLVALTLLATAVAGAAKLIVASDRLADNARDKAVEMQIIKNRIERMTMSDFSDLELWGRDKQRIGADGFSDPDGRFLLSTTITRPTTNLAEVVITVDTMNRKTLRYSGTPERVTTYLTEM